MSKTFLFTATFLLLTFASTFAAENAGGETVFKEVCAACHTTGVAGAPVIGNKDAWTKRIDQGVDTLIEHALNGYQGQHGFMPPRGGQPKLTDGEVKSAVEYMILKSK